MAAHVAPEHRTMKTLVRRLRKLEKTFTPQGERRRVVRFEGPGSERFAQPREEDIDENARIIVVRFVSAKDGRPALSVPMVSHGSTPTE